MRRPPLLAASLLVAFSCAVELDPSVRCEVEKVGRHETVFCWAEQPPDVRCDEPAEHRSFWPPFDFLEPTHDCQVTGWRAL